MCIGVIFYSKVDNEGGKRDKVKVMDVKKSSLQPAHKGEMNNVENSLPQSNSESPQMEKYVPKVIIKGKWGNKPGEVGLPEELGLGGPCNLNSLILDNEGYIYILDSANPNNRIQKFDKIGNYVESIPITSWYEIRSLYIDSENNIYTLTYSSFYYGVIERYYKDIGWKEICRVDSEIGCRIKKDIKGNWYIISGNKCSYQVTKGEDPIPIQEQKKMKKEGIKGEGKNPFSYKITYEKENRYITILNDDREIKKKILICREEEYIKFLKADEEENIYIIVKKYQPPDEKEIEEKEISKAELWKYNKNGSIIAKIKMSWYIDTRFITPLSNAIAIDNVGNIYQLKTLKNGIQVIKWERK